METIDRLGIMILLGFAGTWIIIVVGFVGIINKINGLKKLLQLIVHMNMKRRKNDLG